MLKCVITLALCFVAVAGHASSAAAPLPRPAIEAEGLPAYVPRFGRTKPVIAVIGENTFTELTDYVVPYGVLQASGLAEVFALGTRAGPIQMFPALKIRPQASIDAFDARFAEGADYVIVPAVHRTEDPALLNWISSQARKGASIVGICDGVWVLANAGLLQGRTAVGHWYSFDKLVKKFPDTRWQRDRRYVADGKIITTTGVTASLPVSLALVAAIGGHQRAAALASALGVEDWSDAHRSSDFKLGAAHLYTAASNWSAFWAHDDIGIPVAEGINDISLALTSDAYSRTYRSQVVSVSSTAQEVRTLGGLLLIVDRQNKQSKDVDRLLKPVDNLKPADALDAALQDIAATYGRATAAFVALQMEYPQPRASAE